MRLDYIFVQFDTYITGDCQRKPRGNPSPGKRTYRIRSTTRQIPRWYSCRPFKLAQDPIQETSQHLGHILAPELLEERGLIDRNGGHGGERGIGDSRSKMFKTRRKKATSFRLTQSHQDLSEIKSPRWGGQLLNNGEGVNRGGESYTNILY